MRQFFQALICSTLCFTATHVPAQARDNLGMTRFVFDKDEVWGELGRFYISQVTGVPDATVRAATPTSIDFRYMELSKFDGYCYNASWLLEPLPGTNLTQLTSVEQNSAFCGRDEAAGNQVAAALAALIPKVRKVEPDYGNTISYKDSRDRILFTASIPAQIKNRLYNTTWELTALNAPLIALISTEKPLILTIKPPYKGTPIPGITGENWVREFTVTLPCGEYTGTYLSAYSGINFYPSQEVTRACPNELAKLADTFFIYELTQTINLVYSQNRMVLEKHRGYAMMEFRRRGTLPINNRQRSPAY